MSRTKSPVVYTHMPLRVHHIGRGLFVQNLASSTAGMNNTKFINIYVVHLIISTPAFNALLTHFLASILRLRRGTLPFRK